MTTIKVAAIAVLCLVVLVMAIVVYLLSSRCYVWARDSTGHVYINGAASPQSSVYEADGDSILVCLGSSQGGQQMYIVDFRRKEVRLPSRSNLTFFWRYVISHDRPPSGVVLGDKVKFDVEPHLEIGDANISFRGIQGAQVRVSWM